MRVLTRFLVISAFAALIAASAFAQTTASLTGQVTTDGKPLPGVTVTISSPNLQGSRTAVTGDNGGFERAAVNQWKARAQLPGDFSGSGSEQQNTTRLLLQQVV